MTMVAMTMVVIGRPTGRRGDDPAGLLLGMVEVDDALSNRVLCDLGVQPDEVPAAIQGSR